MKSGRRLQVVGLGLLGPELESLQRVASGRATRGALSHLSCAGVRTPVCLHDDHIESRLHFPNLCKGRSLSPAMVQVLTYFDVVT